jgi:uncharacterized protein YjbI with pentapeptide repeats
MQDEREPQGTNQGNNAQTSLTTFGKNHPALVFMGAVLLYALSGFGLGWFLNWYIDPSATSTPSTAKKDLVQAVAFVLAGLAGIIGVYFTWRNLNQTRKHTEEQLEQARKAQADTQKSTQETLELTNKGQITERFTRAIDQLGKADNGRPQREIRLGGIYALERIAIEAAEEYHWPIMQVLIAYLREQVPWQGEYHIVDTKADIQASLTVIGSRARYYREGEDESLNLSGLDLSNYDLYEAHLEGAVLAGTHLELTGLYGAHLQEADLEAAHLEGAILENANLRRADLRGAYFDGANLLGADLREADLGGADFTGAAIRGADLREVVDLSPQMLERMNGDSTTQLPENREPPAWWSTLPKRAEPLDLNQQYSIKICNVPLRFSGAYNLWYPALALPDTLFLSPTGISTAGSMLSFNHLRWVCDPEKPGEDDALKPAPPDMEHPDLVHWFRNHPYLRVENFGEIEIGGVVGKEFDVDVSGLPDELRLGSVRPRLPLFPSAPRRWPFELREGNKNRIIVLTIQGETITIIIESLPDEFEYFLVETKELLDSVQWGS